ncbi:MAG: hypothetical protein ACOX1J_02730 [Dethiobacteria bacterium]
MKLDVAPGGFDLQGLFVAIFGDGQPLTEDLEEQVPTGVIIVNPENGEYEWFLKNKDKPRAGRWGDGLKRTVDVKFDREGQCIYVLDFGVMEFTDFAPNAIPRTGVLWRIEKSAANAGNDRKNGGEIKEEERQPEQKPDKARQEERERQGNQEQPPGNMEEKPEAPGENEPEIPEQPNPPGNPGNLKLRGT